MGSLLGRVGRLRRDVRARRPPGPLVVLVDPTRARPPGLHRDGPPGSLVAVWSCDLADSVQTVSPDRVPPHALIVGGDIDPAAI